MSSSVTISLRSLVLTTAAATAVVLAYLIGSAPPGAAPAFAATPAVTSEDVPTISMNGRAEATGVPDQLGFGLTIRATGSDVSTALADANRTTRDVLEAVRTQGIDGEDVQTTGLSIRPEYDYSGYGSPVLIGYSASEKLSVLVRSLPDAGATISAAVQAGGNAVRLHGVRLQIGDQDGLMRRAREAAIAEARAKAEQYAEASGLSLGEVLSVREVHTSSTVSPVAAQATLDEVVPGKVPIRAGSADLGVTVAVVWSFA